MTESESGFVRPNREPAEVIPIDFRGGRQYRIDLGRASLFHWHKVLMKNGSDPDLRARYERSLAHTRLILDDFEFEEAQTQACELLLKELGE